ncbi:MAG TPA: PIG-L family deacetylase [Panacibacter sp.]|nr:PIG-L family deacetylase [Panacibacter sp.]HNP43932.1 PIG-L family deacetylase [Panacibacter sp.]
MIKKIPTIVFCFSLLFSHSSFLQAQTPASYNSSDIYLQLKKLNVLGSVLYIAAHPDDENTRLLAYLAKEKQYRTGYMSLTRGDGGQNLIGDEQGIELGLIRTQELLSARRIDGAEQFFSRAFDFGFCKTSTEAISTWGHDKILSDVVWVIRKFQPDVIITRFPGDERAGHGHHQASEILAKEAFTAAADPNMFPEQLKQGVQVWQAKRILWNTFNFGTTNTTNDKQYKIDVGVYNSLLGKSYGEIASESRSQHKSQGFGVPRQRGQAFEYFEHTAGDSVKTDLMDGVTTTWDRIGGGASIQTQINNIISSYNFEHPENAVAALVDLYKHIQQLSTNSIYWESKLEDVRKLIIACSGVYAEATAAAEYAVQGDSIKVQFFVNKRNNAGIELKEIKLNGFDSSFTAPLGVNKNLNFTKAMLVKGKQISQPYWLANPMDKGSFNVSDQQLIGSAQSQPEYSAAFTFTAGDISFTVTRPVQYKFTDPVKGELYEPVAVIPPVIVSVTPAVVMTNIQPGNEQTANMQLHVQYKSNVYAKNVIVTLNIHQGATVVYTKDSIVDFEPGKIFETSVPVKNVVKKNKENMLSVDISTMSNGDSSVYTQYLKAIQYDHIPHISYFYRDEVKLVSEPVKVKGKTIGYITGAGDKVPQALTQMGYDVKLLNEANITEDNLKQFDAVIAGVRAYNVNDWLTGKYNILMHYVHNGGNYIVQYNTSNFVSTVSSKIGPYPFTISRTRVTDENAAVNILLPNTPALNTPNKITPKDFEGWVQERSIYQAEKPDSNYIAPFGMHDAKETETNGSLIIAKYGKGNFVYTGLVFFRELPAAVPGAYKLFANLVGLPKNK